MGAMIPTQAVSFSIQVPNLYFYCLKELNVNILGEPKENIFVVT